MAIIDDIAPLQGLSFLVYIFERWERISLIPLSFMSALADLHRAGRKAEQSLAADTEKAQVFFFFLVIPFFRYFSFNILLFPF